MINKFSEFHSINENIPPGKDQASLKEYLKGSQI